MDEIFDHWFSIACEKRGFWEAMKSRIRMDFLWQSWAFNRIFAEYE